MKIPAIGSSLWFEELNTIGVTADQVKARWQQATDGISLADVEITSIDFSRDEAAESYELDVDADTDPEAADTADPDALQLACYLLLHEERPEYAVFLEIRAGILLNYEVTHKFWSWFHRQLAAMYLYSSEKVIESLLYYLWVDPFEVPKEAKIVFKELLVSIPIEKWENLLPVTGPVPWDEKAELYKKALAHSSLHAALKEAMVRSFLDIYGKVDAVQCAKLLCEMSLGQDKVDETLKELVGGPQQVWIKAVGTPSKAGAKINNGDYMLQGLDLGIPRLVVQSEVWYEKQFYGRVVHFHPGLPTNEPFAWKGSSIAPPEGTRNIATVYVVAGSLDGGRKLAGKVVELWPPGLKEHLTGWG